MGSIGDAIRPVSMSAPCETSDQTSSTNATSQTQDVAIVGMSCRTAGGNNTPAKLWQFLINKKHGSGEVPRKRWEPWLRRDPRNAKIIENTTSKGYFIDDLENFDAAFFGISPKEAELMDPHQRLALELAWEALENAGISPKSLAGSDTAVFMGVDSDDYSRLIMEDLPNVEAWSGIGTAYHGIPNRISYHLDLMGPSTAVDAACASSLIAIHFGRQAILSGESNVALCGGVNVLCAPGLTRMLEKAGALSPDGVCISFDDDAHGYARGEGGAIIVLKKLSSAIADDDNILAVLKGTATAQDGKTSGIMAPNSKAQEMVARQALARAGNMDPSTVGYIEAHATSTSLGDPTEISAMSNVYGCGRLGDSSPCAIGSIKPNVGHLEAAAGAIGFVKAVLAVSKGELAPQTLLKKLNRRIDWASCGLKVIQEPSTWPESPTPRRAAVCSYGYGGSVAHAIIEQPMPFSIAMNGYRETEATMNIVQRIVTPICLVLSSFQEKRLGIQAKILAKWLDTEGRGENLAAVANTLALRRSALDYRAAFTVTSHADAVKSLNEFVDASPGQWASSNRILRSHVKKDVVWVFSGHGAQWQDMGKDLIHIPAFHQAVSRLDNIFENEAGFSALLALEKGDLGGSDRIQILTYAVQIGLVEVLKSKGIQPNAIIGHSVGEIAASVTAGCISPEEGALIVSRRAELYNQVRGQGGMVFVSLPFLQVANELRGRRDVVPAISCSPYSCVVSGDISATKEYSFDLERRGIKKYVVRTDIAFHSPILEQFVDPLTSCLSGVLDPRPASIPIYSTSCEDSRCNSLRGSDYWIRNMVRPVRLHEAVEAAIDDGYRLFLEVSTHPIVSHSINETLEIKGLDESAVVGTMKRNTPAGRSIIHAISQLFTWGASVNFKTQLGECQWATTVPGTPWVHKPYWKNVQTPSISAMKAHNTDEHTLLGQQIDITSTDIRIFTTTLDAMTKPYPFSHLLDGKEIIPAAVYCNTFRQATGADLLEDLQLRVPTTMTADLREIQIIISGKSVKLASRLSSGCAPDAKPHDWIVHASCGWRKHDVSSLESEVLDSTKIRIGTRFPNNFAWDYLQSIGVSGIAYPWAVLEHHGDEKEMIVKMDMDPENDTVVWNHNSWSPFLDAATSVGSSIFFNNPKMRIISSIEQLHFVSLDLPPKVGYLHIQEASDEEGLAANINVLSEQGKVLAKMVKMRFSDVEATCNKSVGANALVHQLAWVPPRFSETSLSLDHIVLISSNREISKNFSRDLERLSKIFIQGSSVEDLGSPVILTVLKRKNTVVIYVPDEVILEEHVTEKAQEFSWEITRAIKILASFNTSPKLFIVTDNVQKAASPTALAQAPLFGFARIAAQEHSENWGGLIDNEGSRFPVLALKYVQDQDVISVQDGLPRIAMMKAFTKDQRVKPGTKTSLLPKPHGTYVVTGGFGDIGLEVLDFLVTKGARRIVVISRRKLPPRKEWHSAKDHLKVVIDKLQALEANGATIYSIALDIGAPNAHKELLTYIDALNLPAVLGVIHLAGVNEDGLISTLTQSSLSRIYNPKIAGALALHQAYPPPSTPSGTTLDFFLLFSSIGQLIGTSGQAAYGASNSFLDTLASHRRQQGDNAIAIQWTAWRGMGLAKGKEYLNEELKCKGITDVSVNEGFRAWEIIGDLDTDHAVVTRARVLRHDEPVPIPFISQIVQRHPPPSILVHDSTITAKDPQSAVTLSTRGKADIDTAVKRCLSTVLHYPVSEIDHRISIMDLGVDSIMSVALRRELLKSTGIRVSPGTIWKIGTVQGLIDWCWEQLQEKQ